MKNKFLSWHNCPVATRERALAIKSMQIFFIVAFFTHFIIGFVAAHYIGKVNEHYNHYYTAYWAAALGMYAGVAYALSAFSKTNNRLHEYLLFFMGVIVYARFTHALIEAPPGPLNTAGYATVLYMFMITLLFVMFGVRNITIGAWIGLICVTQVIIAKGYRTDLEVLGIVSDGRWAGGGLLILGLFVYFMRQWHNELVSGYKAHARARILKEIADTDELTGCLSRRAGMNTLKTFIDNKREYSIAFIDLDHFKDVNEVQGHLGGDKALQKIADIFNEVLRDRDIVIRWGGDEFMVILPKLDEETSVRVLERIRSKVEEEFKNYGVNGMTVSIGVATPNVELQEDVETITRKIDQAVYCAKDEGRNRIKQFTLYLKG